MSKGRTQSDAWTWAAMVWALVMVGLAFVAPQRAVVAAMSDAQQDPKSDYALIFGTVWGPDDQPVYGVKVKLRRAGEKKVRWELFSNHRGEFAQRVPVGRADYVISAEGLPDSRKKADKSHSMVEVTVHVENNERVDTSVHLIQ